MPITAKKILYRYYCIGVLLTAVAVLVTIACINYRIDPYRMWGQGSETFKPSLQHRVRLLKAYEIRNIQPESLLLGTSRSHLGFRTAHPGWQQKYSRRYNAAFDGATTKEMFEYLVHAQHQHPLRQVLLGLETYHPTNAPGTTRPDFDRSLLQQTPGWFGRVPLLGSDARLLTSYDTFVGSIETIQHYNTNEVNWYARDGQRLGEVFFGRADSEFHLLTPRGYFEKINEMEVGFKLEWAIPRKEAEASTAPTTAVDPLSSLDYIERIINICAENEIALDIFFTPAHAHQIELTARTVGWSEIARNKRAVLDLIEKHAAKFRQGATPALWDFSGYSTITMERMPPRDSSEQFQYYWDSSHFKEIVGDWVLDKIFAIENVQIPKDFGYRLTSDNFSKQQEWEEQLRNDYLRNAADEINVLQSMIDAYKTQHGIP